MLNETRVLKYIKDNLGFPFMFLEKTDEEIMDHVREYSLREFSGYIPQGQRILVLDTTNIKSKVPNIQNKYYLTEPDGLEIMNVVNIYSPTGDLLIHGHPPLGPLDHFALREWALNVEMANELKQFSSFDKSFEFIHPNILRISPYITTDQSITVEYERMQPPDFSGIPNEFQILFCDLALADTQILIGRIRKRYSDLKTPFGDIPISSEIFDEGKEKKKEIIDKLQTGTLTNVIVDFR